MPKTFVWLTMVAAFVLGNHAAAQPPRYDDLPRAALQWPKSWALLVGEIVPAPKDFEKAVLAKIDALVQTEPLTKETYPFADTVLAATLRHHQSLRRPAPFADNPWQATHAELQDRLTELRKEWLDHLRKSGDVADALRLADAWAPVTPKSNAVGGAIQTLWIDQANAALDKMDFTAARTWMTRLEESFDDLSSADEVAKRLRGRAEMLQKEADSMPDAQAIRTLEQALTLWPRLPGARDALERRQGTFATLVIAVPALPEQLSPATAATEVERQTLDLLFDRLYHTETPPLGMHYRPQLATSLPDDGNIPLRRDLYWSDGRRLTAADVRHTALMMNQADFAGRSALWRDYLELPRQGSDSFSTFVAYRQGLLQPLAPLTFHVLPQYYQGKQLSRADDPEFAKVPLGSGPYQYVGRKADAGRVYAIFQVNPHDLRGASSHMREIRMLAVNDLGKNLTKPLPHMILDAPTTQLANLKTLGYAEVRLAATPRVHFLALNHRKTALTSAPLRRALAHALDRQALLNRHFRGSDANQRYHHTLNGPMPRSSWAACPAPRVPDELFNLEKARLFAKQATKDVAAVDWTIQFRTGDVHVENACKEMARSIADVLREAGIKADVKAQPVPPAKLRQAVHEHKFDLVYLSDADLDDPLRLALLFDPQADATRPGGSNYLGYDSDVKLQELLRSAVKHRQFSTAQTNMHAVHEHLNETMPLIPLWQLDRHVLLQPTLHVPGADSSDVFARVREWSISR